MTDRALLFNLPHTIHGFVKKTAEPDGDFYDIVVNARLTREMNRASYVHEEDHIEEDFEAENNSADEIEQQRH